MILDKENGSLIQFYDSWNGKLYTRDNCPEKELCFVPKFVDQMNETFLSKIDGIMAFNFGKPNTGHLVFINIESKTMFCVVLETEDLFPKVNKKKNIF